MLGGMAIFAGVLIGVLSGATELSSQGVGLLLGSAFLLAVGAFDDRYAFRPQAKLIAQILGACIVVGFGVGFQVRPVQYFNAVVSILWIVAIINAINLMDNMDGLAPGVSLVGAVFLAYQLAGSQRPEASPLAAALAGSLGGFLLFNFPPARIFMGDAGSLSVGLLLSGLSLSSGLLYEKKLGALSVLLGPALVLAVPLLDVLLVSVTRLLRGQPISQGGRDHSSHRLMTLGLSERKTLLVFYAFAAAAGLVGSQLAGGGSLLKAMLLVPLSWIPLGLFFAWLAKVKVVAREEKPEGAIGLLLGWVFKRRMTEIFMDLVLAFAAFCLAYGLRFDFHVEEVYRMQIGRSVPWVLGLTISTLHAFGVYGGMWEHYGIRDIFRMGKAVGTAVLLCVAIAVLLFRFDEYPRSVFPLYGALLFLALLAARSSFHLFELALVNKGDRRTLIYGTGPRALSAYALITAEQGRGAVAGFIDDGKGLSKLQGLPVYSIEGLRALNGRCPHDMVLICSRSENPEVPQALQEHVVKNGIALRRFEITYHDV
jgi:UDP-GlcNAc:undecaprenyl-phosphate GlcNAc-1-phosphate transferase